MQDRTLLFVTRSVRLFAYGFLSVILALYLSRIGLSDAEIGLLVTLTLLGDAAISLLITTTADRVGRRRMLLLGAMLMAIAGVVFALTESVPLLVVAAIIGVISPGGNEIGPFLSIEQAALSQLSSDERRTHVFAWYTLSGSLAAAAGALAGGWITQMLQMAGLTAVGSYRALLFAYAGAGVVLFVCFALLSPRVEVAAPVRSPSTRFGLHRSRNVVLKLSSLFALDAFAGGFIVQSILVYWFHLEFGADTGLLGTIFFAANLLAGLSSLLASRLARRFGLVNTMVFTHIPSNLLLLLVPLMPTLELAVAVLLARFAISQMDVPTRQSYTMAVVAPDERSAASGITTIARSVGASLSPALTGILLAHPVLRSVPFFLAGGLKIVYDLILYWSFRQVRPPEERNASN